MDVLLGLRHSRTRSIFGGTRVHRGRFQALSHEDLEGRQLLTTVQLPEPMRDSSLELEVSSAFVENAADGVLDIEFNSLKSESVLIQLTFDIQLTKVTAYGPAGDPLDSWQNLADPWQAINPYASWIVGTTSEVQGVHRVHVEFTRPQVGDASTSFFVTSYHGVPTIDAGHTDAEGRLDLELKPLAARRSSLKGWLPAQEPQVMVRSILGPWTFSSSDSLQRSIQATRIEPGKDAIVLPSLSIPESEVETKVGTWISYDSGTGRVVVRSPEFLPLTALEIRNDEGLFIGQTPPMHGDNPFNIYQPNKLFNVYPSPKGRSYVDFGTGLPPGLTREEITSKLKVDGAYQGGGGLQSVVFSVDGDISFEEAVKSFKRRLPSQVISSYADTNVDVVAGDNYEVHVAYKWDASTSSLGSSSPSSRASIQYRFPHEWRWQTLIDLESCKGICHAVGKLEALGGTVQFRIENSSFNAPLTISALDLHHSDTRRPIRYHVDVAEHQVVTVTSSSSSMDVRDENEQIVASSVGSLELGGTREGVSRYYFDFLPTSPLVSVLTSRFDRVARDRQARIASRAGEIDIQVPASIDQRSCDFSQVSWDGPTFTGWKEYHSYATFQFVGPVEQRDYSLTIPAHSCRMTSGDWLAGGEYTVDYLPPKIVSIPTDGAKDLPDGVDSAFIYFDESVHSWSPPIDSVIVRHKATDSFFGAISVDSVESGLRLRFPPLSPGDYEIAISGLEVSDSNASRMIINELTFPFSVGDEKADAANSAFDIDRNQIIDPRDFELFQLDLWISPRSYLDLNKDGAFNEEDTDEWIARTGIFPDGDVTMDGAFNIDDLERLATLSLDLPASWQSGDFDGDGLYTTTDLILAMQFGLEEVSDDGG